MKGGGLLSDRRAAHSATMRSSSFPRPDIAWGRLSPWTLTFNLPLLEHFYQTKRSAQRQSIQLATWFALGLLVTIRGVEGKFYDSNHPRLLHNTDWQFVHAGILAVVCSINLGAYVLL